MRHALRRPLAKKLKAVTCRFDAAVVKKKPTKTGAALATSGEPPVPHLWMELTGGVLAVAFDWHIVDTQPETREFLPKHL